MKKRSLLHFGIAVFIVLALAGCENPNDPPKTTVVNKATIQGVTVPARGGTPVTAITPTDQYTGTVAWNGNPTTFAANTKYTATITLTVKEGYTLTGVAKDYFTVAGATATNAANSGVITAVFPAAGVTPTYGISLSVSGTHTFAATTEGYTAQTPLTVTVTNTLNTATGGLSVALSGADSGSFTLSGTSISSIATGGTGTFTVVPKTGLAVKTYSATVTVSGSNGITAGFNVSFTVDASISLSVSGTHTFAPATVGYAAQTPLTVTVTNTRNTATGGLSVALSGTDSGRFTLSGTSINSIAAGGADTFTVAPKTGLDVKTYSATVTVSGSNGITAGFNVSFTVDASISLSVSGTHTFAPATVGYAAQTPLTVTVTNTGNTATGGLSVALSGTDSGSFTLSGTSINSIAAGDTGTFTVAPRNGLAIKTYAATVTVWARYESTFVVVDSTSFNVSFTVAAVSGAYIITGSGTAFTATRDGATIGTADQSIQNVIDAIRTNAAGTNCTIQFGGDGVSVLDIGAASVNFNNIGGTWGLVTLMGKISSAYPRSSDIIYIADTVSVTSSADINIINLNNSNLNTPYNAITGAVSISAGKVSSVRNNSSGKITVSGTAEVGKILLEDGVGASGTAVRLEISGGTISSVRNNSSGKITVSGTAEVGEILLEDGTDTSGTAVRLEISGGTIGSVRNNSSGVVNISGGTVGASYLDLKRSDDYHAVYNSSSGTVNISGGTVNISVSAQSEVSIRCYAVYNGSSGTVNISSGTVNISGSSPYMRASIYCYAVYNGSSGTVNISGGSVNSSGSAGNQYGDASFYTVYNASTGAVSISGGNVNNSGVNNSLSFMGVFPATVFNVSTGTLSISGGTVSATTGTAVCGKTTVSGMAKVTSANPSIRGTINSGGGVIEILGGTVENTDNGIAIRNVSPGAVNISGGTVVGTVDSTSTGAVNISGGTVSATTGTAVSNSSTGAVNISGGTVSATSGRAVYASRGEITVSETTKITSANTASVDGTIYLASGVSGAAVRLEISGGTVENTANSGGNAIFNASAGAINISGGTVKGSGSYYAIYNASTGVVTITEPPAVIVGNRYGVQ